VNEWLWITIGVLVIAAGACWQAYALAAKTREQRRKSVRARRAERLREVRAASERADGREEGDDG
jgi:hypothetical protein